MLKLTHSSLPVPAIPPHAEGWDHYCERLKTVAAGGDAGTDPWIKGADAG